MKNKKELELYVHIPFCVKKCAYCDFLSAPASGRERTAYVDALTREIRSRKNDYGDYRVSTIFLGGGTPSILAGDDTARIFRALYESFRISDNAEITMEVNPGTVSEEKAAAWKTCGVNRLSIGLQSVNDEELQMLGRIHTYREFLDTWKLVRREGFENINIDLISAIPGQSLKSWEETLRITAGLNPEHISAYSLIVEEGTPFYERYGEKESTGASFCKTHPMPPLPDEDAEREIYKATEKILAEYGYHRYEISNYSKSGYECRHNLGYWERKEYLGLGLGASSLIGGCRFHNTADMEKYMEICTTCSAAEHRCGSGDAGDRKNIRRDTDVRELSEDIENLTTEDQMEEFMFLGLRKMEGISEKDFYEAFGRNIREVYGLQLKKLEEQKLIECRRKRVRLTERGIDVSNYVFSEFIF